MEIRPINEQEIEVITTAVDRAHVVDVKEEVLRAVPLLNVVGRCNCGCASVDFVPSGQAPPYVPIADAIATTHVGGEVGIIVWGSENEITGLEVYDAGAGELDLRLPVPETIRAVGDATV